MATCLEITLDLFNKHLSPAKMVEGREAANTLTYMEQPGNVNWSGKNGDLARIKYNAAQKVWDKLNAELREVIK